MSADATKVIPSYEDVDADTGMRPGDTTICEDVRGECDRCDIVESHVACGHCCCKVTFFFVGNFITSIKEINFKMRMYHRI